MSQSAFVRGFIDDRSGRTFLADARSRLNPRSCAASSMTGHGHETAGSARKSQSAFVRGFIDDSACFSTCSGPRPSLNPRSCAASSMTRPRTTPAARWRPVSIRVRARLHR